MEKKLYRSMSDKVIGGVCSGLAKYLNQDVSMVRLAVVLISLLFAGGGGVLAYIIAYFVIPEEPAEEAAPAETAEAAEDTAE